MTATRTSRFFALIVDSILCAVVWNLILHVVPLPERAFTTPTPVGGAVLGLYKIICELSAGRSLGQRFFSIAPDYSSRAWWRPLLRNSWCLIPFAGWLMWPATWAGSFNSFQLIIGLSLIFSRSKKHLGDLVSGCHMVMKW
ncbi:RDD family protein [Corynebacterium hindlerae]|uniref:RDD family protein n=1 Tax=Corynebacterium hindlerae TaxID=699041 RepID=A0A7G5FGS2_9CORY|nr:RDD family protein [Corynebacterium hindlerae]